MIIKLCNQGGYARYVEVDSFSRQRLANGAWDLSCSLNGRDQGRFIIGPGDFIGEGENRLLIDGCVAYVMDHGKTVDTVR